MGWASVDRRVAVAVVGVLILGSLGGAWVVLAGDQANVPTPTADHPAEPAFPQTLDDSTSITLRSSGMTGAWDVRVCGDGTVHYVGWRGGTEGYVSYSIPEKDVKRLLVYAYEIDYFAFDDYHEGGLDDGGSYNMTVAVAGTSHNVISVRGGGPSELSEFRSRVWSTTGASDLNDYQGEGRLVFKLLGTEPAEEAPQGCK